MNKPKAFCCHFESWQPVSHWAAFHLQSDGPCTEFSRLSQGVNSPINYWVFSMQAPHFWPITVISHCWFLGDSSSQPSQTWDRFSLGTARAKHTDVITRSVSMWFYMPWNIFMSPFVHHCYHFTSHCTAKSVSDWHLKSLWISRLSRGNSESGSGQELREPVRVWERAAHCLGIFVRLKFKSQRLNRESKLTFSILLPNQNSEAF